MAQSLEKPQGILPQLGAVIVLLVLVSRAGAQSNPTSSDRPWQAPGALSLDPVTGQNRSSLFKDSDETLAEWKSFKQAPLPTEEGEVIFQDPMVGMRANRAPAETDAPWKQWMLPGGLALAAAVVLGAGLAAWRIMAARRATHAADITSRY